MLRKQFILTVVIVSIVVPLSPQFTPSAIAASPNGLYGNLSGATFQTLRLQSAFADDTGATVDTFRDHDGSTMILGQHRKSRRQRGGGALWTNFYMADTVIDDSRYSDVETKPDLWGVQVGYDLKLGAGGTSRLGILYNFNGNYTKWGEQATFGHRSVATNNMLGLTYTSYGALTHFIIRGSVGYDHYEVGYPWFVPPTDEESGIRYPGPNLTADGIQGNLYAEFGFDFVPGDQSWAFKPFFAFDYNYLHRDKMTDGLYDPEGTMLTAASHNAFKSLLGIRINKRFGHFVEVQGRGAWVQQLLRYNPPIYNLNFSMINGTMTPTQYLYNTEAGRSWVWLGASAKFYVGATGMRVMLDYDCLVNGFNVSHIANLGFLFTW